MDRSSIVFDRTSVRPSTREVQASWSPAVRQERAQAGRRRLQEFLSLVSATEWPGAPSNEEEEVWAVGALGDDDWQRLVKRCG